MVLPVLTVLTMALAWLLMLAATQVRVVDAAREVARATARDEDPARALALGRRVAPGGSRITVRSEQDTVVVSVRSQVHGPRGLMLVLPTATLHAEAVAAREAR